VTSVNIFDARFLALILNAVKLMIRNRNH